MTTVAKLMIEMAANVAGIRRDMAQANDAVQRSTERMRKAAVLATRALGAIGAALSVSAIANASAEFGRFSRELEKFSGLTGVTTAKFQELSFGAKTFGIEQDKLADILKDTQDKVGDFLATGAGGMADFFENIAPLVGVTAENFRSLNGADALQLYVSSLQKANISQAEMVFYMEAIASDSTALIPLFGQNGKAINDFAKEAKRLGVVLDEDAIAKAKELDSQMIEFTSTLEGAQRELLQKLAPALISVAEGLQTLIVETPKLVEEFKPFLVGGSVALGLIALPKLITGVAVAVTTRLLPALIALGPYAAAFVALGAAFSGVMHLLQDSKKEFEDIAQAETTIAGLEKQLVNAQAHAEKGSVVAKKRVIRIKRELAEAQAAYDLMKAAVKSAGKEIEKTATTIIKTTTLVTETSEERKKRLQAEKKAIQELAKVEQDAMNRKIEVIQTEMDATEEIKRQTREIIEQTKAIGASEKELLNLSLAKIDDQIQTRKQSIEMISFGDANDELIAEYKRQIQALEELKKARVKMYDKQQAQKVIDQSKQTATAIESNIVKAFEDAFLESGDLASSLRRAIEVEFSRMVIQPIVGSVSGSLFGGGAGVNGASGSSSLSGLISGGQSVSSLFNAFSGSLVSSVSGVIGSAGAAFGSSAISAFATGMKGSTLAAGLAGPTTAGATGAMGLGATVGAALPWVAGALAISSLIGGIGSNKISASNLSSEFTQEKAKGIADVYSSIASSLGGSASASFAFSGNTGRQGQNPNFNVSAWMGGNRLFSGFDTRQGITGDNGTFLGGEIPLNDENLALYTTRAVVAALQASDFMDNIDALFDSADVRSASIEQLNGLLADAQILNEINNAFDGMTGALGQLSGASIDTVKQFLNLSGGMENLNRNMGVYYSQFTSEQEQFARLSDDVASILSSAGGKLFSTRSEFKQFFDNLGLMDFGTISNSLGVIDQYYDEIERREKESYDATLKSLDEIKNAGRGIADYLRQMGVTEQTLSPQQRLQNSAAEFNRLIGLSRVGDAQAMSQVTGASSQFLDSARSYFGSSAEYKAIYEQVRADLQSLPGVQDVSNGANEMQKSNADLLNELKMMRADIKDAGSINLKVVTVDGKVLMESTIDQIRERSYRGELIVHASGVR